MTVRTTTSKIALLLASVLATLVLAEGILRWMSLDTLTGVYYKVPDPNLGWRLQPSVSYRFRTPEYDVNVTHNSRGWRDTEHGLTNEPRRYRILVLGDSFMEGHAVNSDDIFARQLERLARQRGLDIEVINLGVGGYGTLQEYLSFVQEGRLYRPDMVLLAFCLINDLVDNTESLQKSSTYGLGTLYFARPFVSADDNELTRITQPDYQYAVRIFQIQDLFFRRSVLLQQAFRMAFRVFGASASQRAVLRYGSQLCEPSDEYRRAWSITENILRRLKNDVTATGAELAVFPAVSLEDSTLASQTQIIKGSLAAAPFCLVDTTAYRRLSDILSRHRIKWIDLLPAFRKATQAGNSLHYPRDQHWNEGGHRLAAEEVLTFLEDHGLSTRKVK